ncbi:MAG: glycerate kinase type-2 family protein [Candidatus Acidiferrales bacterium]
MNAEATARTDWKQAARQMLSDTLAAANIGLALAKKVVRSGSRIRIADAEFDLAGYRRIVGIAFGKAAFAMAAGLSDLLAPDFRAEGILVVPTIPPRSLAGWQTFIGGHPVPTAQSFAAARAILQTLGSCGLETLVFFLLSGGGSALVELPLDARVSLEDFQQLHRLLVTCGASIGEINAIRKHLSATKGGRLAAAAPLATKITLGVSDVPEGEESALASGPTLPDPTTIADAERIAREHKIIGEFPPALREMFERHALIETPKSGDAAFGRAHFSLLLGVHDLTHNAHRAAEAHGCVTICDNSTDNWPVEKAADFLLAQLEILHRANPERPVAVIADGEVSSLVTGDGTGGRNSAFVLACAAKILGKRVTVLSAGTDGIDGNSPAAGAVADGSTIARAKEAGLDAADFFRRSDSYSFFKKLGDEIETGPTGNNLRDLRILIHEA